ncbi:unnamed protein product [Orchesella dallaii]|uniref:Uncharacterized protein n=1 Tax=Orchesella dallaii TaxID=48710 RepID=A0ABP1PLG8_9HEXA
MYRDIDERARTPTLAEEMYYWLRERYWDDPCAIKLGYLFKLNFHHIVARWCSDIAMKRDNIGMKLFVFVWRAKDTPKILNKTLIPLEEECSWNPPEDLIKGIYSKYLDTEMTDSDFFVKDITRASPGGEIKLRLFIRRLTWSRSDSIRLYICWFIT